MAEGPPILEMRDVGYAYGGVWAVNSCSFEVAKGSVTGLIGPNGAGKSTLLEVISGSLQPHRGSIIYEGRDIGGWGAARMGREGVARTFQTARVFARLPVIENVMIGAQAQVGENPLLAMFWQRRWRDQEASLRNQAIELLQWLGLQDHIDKPAGSLSGGQRRLMEMARALMARPRLLLLDEPTAGVFPETSQLIATRVREIADQGVTVLVVAHNMAFLASIADDIVCMAEGKVLTRGTLDYVRQHQDVIAAYLGTTSTVRVTSAGGV
jgi:ABC-type branched-subunit amino acid transport system ATPase component